ncbi:G-type lectin S-receptor-like serine/threonine-protein kinase At4g27290 [Bidens hawaiensis]|uniref:G-type lectin S-receptor-like serine/threonine-protein kinase At4g27290 n=1 Tax=Bidens hawaiensis TaxID=980011 RepID=UPI00404B08BA
MGRLNMILFYCCGLLFILITNSTTAATDTIYPNQTLKDGDTIVSAGGIFELGFFSLGNLPYRYLGIWYKTIPVLTVVWVANTKDQLLDASGILQLNDKGELQLLSVSNISVWSSLSSKLTANSSPVAQLFNSGNLVIRDDISKDLIWQSFDHPGDTWLPGMKIGVDLVTGIQWNLTSWKTPDDPSLGSYTVWMNTDGYPQLYNMKDESNPKERFGYWNGRGFSGMLGLGPSDFYTFDLNREKTYYIYTLKNRSYITRMTLNHDGNFAQLVWNNKTWDFSTRFLEVKCDQYSVCGPYGRCSINTTKPTCACLEGFEPKLPEEWSVGKWSNGCKHIIDLTREKRHYFKNFSDLKLPDSQNSWFNSSISLKECKNLCANNVSCIAFANSDILGGNGCLMWSGELIDIREAPQGDLSGQDLYIKMAIPHKKKSYLKVALPVVSVVVMLIFALILYFWRNKRLNNNNSDLVNKEQKQDSDLPFFSLNEVVKATSNFADNNKLGQGGFGEVYKGVLEEGGEIAVKRLSKTSRQGITEFQNEAICIAKLQHRNLVKLLGCCVQGEEMMLIYEYMPNNSLDFWLFDKNNSLLLDWPQRHHIINGIARGLVYLHQDSRLRIIHRDLKASNILLDSNMNPKISDFGLARMFKEYETEANTNHVVGTLGYISPEYAANGLFSLKSDVFSFGVLVLEIVSGKKNRGFSHQAHHDNLLGHAWRLYKEGKPHELVDVALGGSWSACEVLQSIHVGLLCVQQNADDRPNMSSVVHMLGGEGALPPPEQPGFFMEMTRPKLESSSIMSTVSVSTNKVTITQLEAR